MSTIIRDRAWRRAQKARRIAAVKLHKVVGENPAKWADNAAKCFCEMCTASRKVAGPTIQELRELQVDIKEEIENA